MRQFEGDDLTLDDPNIVDFLLSAEDFFTEGTLDCKQPSETGATLFTELEMWHKGCGFKSNGCLCGSVMSWCLVQDWPCCHLTRPRAGNTDANFSPLLQKRAHCDKKWRQRTWRGHRTWRQPPFSPPETSWRCSQTTLTQPSPPPPKSLQWRWTPLLSPIYPPHLQNRRPGNAKRCRPERKALILEREKNLLNKASCAFGVRLAPLLQRKWSLFAS